MALSTVMFDDQYFSHTTSLLLWGVPLPWQFESFDARLHVTSTARREPRRGGVIGHRLPSAPPTAQWHGVAVSTPPVAWAESRTVLTLDDLIVAGDALVSRWSPVPDPFRPTVAELLEAARNVGKGAAVLRGALEEIREGSRSPAETRLRLLLVRSGLPQPELNFDAYDSRGRWLGCVDIAYPQQRVVIEYEGEHHFTQAEQYRTDIDRRERFAEAGWRTIRVTKEHLQRNPAALVARIARHLAARLQ